MTNEILQLIAFASHFNNLTFDVPSLSHLCNRNPKTQQFINLAEYFNENKRLKKRFKSIMWARLDGMLRDKTSEGYQLKR
jgi:hypothetical protein